MYREEIGVMKATAFSLEQGESLGEAEQVWRHLLETLKAHGEREPAYIEVLESLALNLLRQGDFEQAQNLLQAVCSLKEAVFGESDPQVARTNNILAEVMFRKGDFTRSEFFALSALSIFRKKLDPYDKRIEQVIRNLILIYENAGAGRKSELLDFKGQLETILRRGYPATRPFAAGLRNPSDQSGDN